ncbi:hypothetical protein PTKIN_Ptkin13bG0289700 [Pterospermum kingtungense]
MEKVEPEAPHPHVLFLPFPVQGHVKPMLKLAELLSYAGNGRFQVTFINTEYVHRRFLPSIDLEAFYRRFPKFQFLSIPDALPPDKPRSGEDLRDMLPSIRGTTTAGLRQLLVSLQRQPTCIIADGIMSASAMDVAEEFGIPVLAFRTFSACCIWTYFHLLMLIEEEELPLQDKDMDKPVACIPGLENVFRRRDLPGICRVERPEGPYFQFFVSQATAMLRASALILNTFDELEKPMISKLGSLFSKVYTIGPLHALSNVRIKDGDPSPLASTKSIQWKEDKGCITWLDSQPSKSVVFVSLGSIVTFTHDQMLEFWHGLVRSGKPFLWVIRPDSITGEDDPGKLLMDLEERAKGRGLIVGWAPQEAVLANPAVGGFLTHSGWNSTMESINASVPMICWPAIGDQQVNSRFVSEVWRIGFDMKDCCDRSVIEKMVRDLMEDKREEIMKSMDVIAKQAQESVKEGGSSYHNLELLIEDIKSITYRNL